MILLTRNVGLYVGFGVNVFKTCSASGILGLSINGVL